MSLIDGTGSAFSIVGMAQRSVPDEAERFQTLAAALADEAHRRFRLAELADYLRTLPRADFARAVREAPRAPLDAAALNQLAGMVELAAERRAQRPPSWTHTIPVGTSPTFGSALASVRLHLLTSAPVALRRRNLFADSSLDERV